MDCTLLVLLLSLPLGVALLALSQPTSARRRGIAVVTLVCLFAMVLGSVGLYQSNGRDLPHGNPAATAFYWLLAWGAVAWTLAIVLILTSGDVPEEETPPSSPVTPAAESRPQTPKSPPGASQPFPVETIENWKVEDLDRGSPG